MKTELIPSYLWRLIRLTIAFMAFGLANTMMINAAIGSSSWVALNQGLALHLPLTVGQANTAVGLVIIAIDFLMREPIGIGTFMNAVLIGQFNDMWTAMGIFPTPDTYIMRLVLLLASLFLSAGASVLYMGAAMGCGPRDTLMVMINKKIEKLTMGQVIIIVSVIVLAVSWLLGAPVGLGTVICFTLQGTVTDIVQKALPFKPTKVKHENMLDTLRNLRK